MPKHIKKVAHVVNCLADSVTGNMDDNKFYRVKLCRGFPMIIFSVLELMDEQKCHASNRYVFKEALQNLAELLGVEIRIAHYPPYCLKHNPIGHRLFPHITRACQGVVFHSVEIAKQFIEKAKTNTGLQVTVDILTGIYETGKKYAADFIANMRIVFDDFLPRWNYTALPHQC